MSTSSSRPAASAPLRELRFQHWPLQQTPLRSSLLFTIVLIVSCAAAWAWQRWWLVAIFFPAVSCSLWRLWLPTRWEIGYRGVAETVLGRTRRTSWRDITHCRLGRRGIYLCTSPSHAPLARLTTLFIPYPPDDQRLRTLIRELLLRSYRGIDITDNGGATAADGPWAERPGESGRVPPELSGGE